MQVAFAAVDAAAVFELFDNVAAAVRGALDVADRSAAGERAGQYGLDLDADAAALAVLTAAPVDVLSEESGRHRRGFGVCVVVDPVDGSTNASRGLPVYATSLCACDASGPWVAAVTDLVRGVTYRAERGAGATRDGAPIRVADPVAAPDAIVAVNGWSAERPATAQSRALGCASLELCLVADGTLDGYVGFDPDGHGAWDYLGGWLVLTEAGGVAIDRSGRDLFTTDHADRRTIVAASGAALLDRLVTA